MGLLGNFDANLALYIVPLLVLLIIWQGGARMFLLRGQGADVLRITALFLFACVIFTLWNGANFSSIGVSSYGLDPLGKSVRTAMVPFVLILLLLAGMSLPFFLGRELLQKAIVAAFLVTCLYSLIQFAALFGRGGLHNLLWPFFEGARDHQGLAAIARFGRLSGPTMEPAELAKLVMLLFIPWIIYPTAGAFSARLLTGALGLVLATSSLTGVLLSLIVVLYLWLNEHPSRRWRLIVLAVFALIVFLLFREDLAPSLFERMTRLSDDPSALIRKTYNKAALSIIFEHPWIGVGWSNEVFFFPQRVVSLAYLWEVSQDLNTGNALTAKSLILRLAMYGGAFLTILTLASIAWVLSRGHSLDQKRARLCFGILLVAGSIDGGMLTSFYLWVGPALTLGMLAFARYAEGDSGC